MLHPVAQSQIYIFKGLFCSFLSMTESKQICNRDHLCKSVNPVKMTFNQTCCFFGMFVSKICIYVLYDFFASLIQAQLGCIPVQEFGLIQDTGKIFRNAIRVSKCELKSLNVSLMLVFLWWHGFEIVSVLFFVTFCKMVFLVSTRSDWVSPSSLPKEFLCSAQLFDTCQMFQSQTVGRLTFCFQTAWEDRLGNSSLELDIYFHIKNNSIFIYWIFKRFVEYLWFLLYCRTVICHSHGECRAHNIQQNWRDQS